MLFECSSDELVGPSRREIKWHALENISVHYWRPECLKGCCIDYSHLNQESKKYHSDACTAEYQCILCDKPRSDYLMRSHRVVSYFHLGVKKLMCFLLHVFSFVWFVCVWVCMHFFSVGVVLCQFLILRSLPFFKQINRTVFRWWNGLTLIFIFEFIQPCASFIVLIWTFKCLLLHV